MFTFATRFSISSLILSSISHFDARFTLFARSLQRTRGTDLPEFAPNPDLDEEDLGQELTPSPMEDDSDDECDISQVPSSTMNALNHFYTLEHMAACYLDVPVVWGLHRY
jgi:hypothetical protein